ncbi:hypothetical protein LguiA_033173 [Lonicera macranthoides]
MEGYLQTRLLQYTNDDCFDYCRSRTSCADFDANEVEQEKPVGFGQKNRLEVDERISFLSLQSHNGNWALLWGYKASRKKLQMKINPNKQIKAFENSLI